MYDSDADNNLSLNELVRLLEEIGRKITALPAVRAHIFTLNHMKELPLTPPDTDRPSRFPTRQICRQEAAQARPPA